VLLAAGACTTRLNIDATTVREKDAQVDLGQVVAGCEGTITSDHTTVTFSLSADGEYCVMYIELSGEFYSVADLKQAYRDEVDGYPADSTVTITGLRAAIRDLRLVSPAGDRLVDPVVSYWRASLVIGDIPVAKRSGGDSRSLFGGVKDLDLAAAVDTINDAIATDGTLVTAGIVAVAMDPASITTSLAGNTSATLELKVSLTLDVHVSKSAASEL
jgi:hypothetical protein